MKITAWEVKTTLSTMIYAGELRPPYHVPEEGFKGAFFPEILGDIDDSEFTEEDWNATLWNDPRIWAKYDLGDRYNAPDPEADDKLTWAELVIAVRKFRVIESAKHSYRSAVKLQVNITALAPVPHRHASAAVNIGGGMDHLTTMLHHMSEGERAGQHWPPAIMRDVDGGLLTLHTGKEAGELLSPAAKQKNRASNAGNIVRAKLETLRATALDPTGGLAEGATDEQKLVAREAAAASFEKMLEDLETHFAAALAEVDKMEDEPPEGDLPRAKHFLVTRLESAATAKLEELTGAESQNGIDLHPACQSEGDAMTDIAEAKKIGQIRIERADTLDKAKAAAKKGEEAINAVSALRTPIFERLLTGAATEAINTAEVTFKEKTVSIRARHPNWRDSRHKIPGEVSLFGHPETGEDGTIPAGVYGIYTAPETPSELGEMDVKLIVPAGTKATFKLTGRSVCGPSYLTVTLDAPAEAPAGPAGPMSGS